MRVLLAGLVAVAGCAGPAQPPELDYQEADSAGVSIVQFSMAGADTLDLSGTNPVWTFGAEAQADGAGPGAVLHGVGSMVELADGRIALAEGSTRQVLILDPGTGGMQRLGRAGDGPGEFRAMGALFPTGDGGIAVLDSDRSLVAEFDDSGHLVREDALPRVAETGALPQMVASGNGARFVYVLPGLPSEPGAWRLEGALVRIGDTPDTLRVLRGPEVYRSETVVAGAMIHGASTWLAGAPQGVWVGDGAAPEVHELDTLGATVRIVRWSDGDGEAVTERDREAFFEQVDRAAAEAGGPPGAPPPSAMLRGVLRFAERKPSFGGLMTSPAGDLWVRAAEDPSNSFLQQELGEPAPPEQWTVVRFGTGTGAGTAHRVILPRGFGLRSIVRETLLGVYRDELGVETVRGYRWPRT